MNKGSVKKTIDPTSLLLLSYPLHFCVHWEVQQWATSKLAVLLWSVFFFGRVQVAVGGLMGESPILLMVSRSILKAQFVPFSYQNWNCDFPSAQAGDPLWSHVLPKLDKQHLCSQPHLIWPYLHSRLSELIWSATRLCGWRTEGWEISPCSPITAAPRAPATSIRQRAKSNVKRRRCTVSVCSCCTPTETGGGWVVEY